MLESITLLGSSSGRNAGDAALLDGIMNMIDHRCDQPITYEIPTIRPDFLHRHYANQVRPIGMFPWQLALRMLGVPTYRSVMRTDLSLVFDAILFDRSLWNPMFNFLSTLHLILRRAKRKGRRMGLFNVGVGPVETSQGRRMLAELVDSMDFITVRDRDSADLLLETGIDPSRIIETADAALVVPGPSNTRVHAIIEQLGLANEGEFFAVNVNRYLATWSGSRNRDLDRGEFLNVYAQALNRFAQKTGAALLFVATQHHDVAITSELRSMIKSTVKTGLLTNRAFDHREIIGVLGKASMLFAMRLHAVILATSSCTPVIGLAYQPKVTSYFRQLGIEQHCLKFDQFDVDALYQHMLDGWENRQTIHKKLCLEIPLLKSRAQIAADLVGMLHNDEDINVAVAHAAAASRNLSHGSNPA